MLAFATYMPYSPLLLATGGWGCFLGPRDTAYPSTDVSIPEGFVVTQYVECRFPGYVTSDIESTMV